MSFSNNSKRAGSLRYHRNSYPTLWMALTLVAVLTVVSGIAYRRGDWTKTQTASATPAFVISHSIVPHSNGSTEPITTGSGGVSNLSIQDKTTPNMQKSRVDVDDPTPR